MDTSNSSQKISDSMASTSHEEAPFNIVEASIAQHRAALASGRVTSVELVIAYLIRIGKYDLEGGDIGNGTTVQPLNAFTIINPKVLEEASASDVRRASGLPLGPLEGIPYTLKDSYSYKGLTVTNGSPALVGLNSKDDSAIAARLRAAGGVLLGKTNMPPMAAGGMQRGLYGRAESPYNTKYLTAAFSSGSSNGASTSTASSMGVFGMASETVSSGRSAASNNALACYTPSRGIVTCRGLVPLYVTCDTPVPFARSMEDLVEITSVIAGHDLWTEGDFWREQNHVKLPEPPATRYDTLLKEVASLKRIRIGVPKIYVGQQDSNPHAKPTVVSDDVVQLWEQAKADLEALGAKVVYTDFPLVTNYENDSASNEANNVVGAPAGWNKVERSSLIAKAWDEFLRLNNDPKLSKLADVDPNMLFPKPKDYIPDTFLELRNWIDYPGLPDLAKKLEDMPLQIHPGLGQALRSLEAQRKRDLEDWMDEQRLDCVAFPAAGDVGFADLETNLESATHSLKNGVKYSNGNRAIRHLGVPTVSVPMGIMPNRQIPVNLTFAGKAYEDDKLMQFAYAYEKHSQRRTQPPLTPGLSSDNILCPFNPVRYRDLLKTGRSLDFTQNIRINSSSGGATVEIDIKFKQDHRPWKDRDVEVWMNGSKKLTTTIYGHSAGVTLDHPDVVLEVKHEWNKHEVLGWDLKPMKDKLLMILVVARAEYAPTYAQLWIHQEPASE